MEVTNETRHLLTCPVCKGLLCIPRYFDCLHTFCTPCLDKHSSAKPYEAKIMCPECGLMSKFASEAVDLPVNELLVRTIQELSQKDIEELRQRCGICTENSDGSLVPESKGKKAVILCEDCKEFMCEKCKEVHQDIFRGKNKHKVISLAEVQRGGSKIFRSLTLKSSGKEKCVVHKKETLKLYCNLCDKPVCVVCKVTNHDEHQCTSIEDAVAESKEQIGVSMQEIEEKFHQVEEAENVWKGHMGVLEHKESFIKQDIEKYVNDLVEQIYKWQRLTVRVVESVCETERAYINKNLNKVQKNKESLITVKATAKQLNTRGRRSHVLSMKDVVIERARNLEAAEVHKPQIAVQFKLKESIDTGQFTGESIGLVVTNERGQMENQRVRKQSENFSGESSGLGTSMEAVTAVISGTVRSSFSVHPPTESSPCKITGIALGNQDDLFVVDNMSTTIKHFSVNGNLEKMLDLRDVLSVGIEKKKLIPNPLWDCAVLPDGNIITASAYGVHVLSNEGTLVVAMDTDCEYTSVVVSTKNNKAVAYSNKDCRVVTFDLKSRTKTSSFVISLKYAVGTVGSVGYHLGNILVSDMHADSVKVYNPLGRKLFEMGKHGREPGLFIKPRGICADSQDNIYVADKGNHRIQRFTAKGKFQGIVLSKVDGLETPVDVTLAGNGDLVIVTEKGKVYFVITNYEVF